MHTWVRRALCAVGLTGGVVLLGIGLAQGASADDGDGPVTTGENGILSGNQTGVDADAPVNLSGNQVTVIGQHNHTTATGGASSGADGAGSAAPSSSGESGIGSGNQTAVDADAPVNVSGNQVTVIGQDNTVSGSGGSSTGSTDTSGGPGSGSAVTSGESGIGSGNQTAVDADVPVNVSGNQVTVIGQDNTVESAADTSTAGPSSGSPTTTGQNGVVAGNQTAVGIQLPVNASGNQVTVIGQDNTVTSGAGSTDGSAGPAADPLGSASTSGEDGIVSGNQTGVAALVPVNASGNQVTAVGQDNTLTSTAGTSSSPGGSTGGSTGPGGTTTGEDGIGSGNQTPIDVQVPVDVSGNQVTVVGQDNTVTSTGGSSTGGTTTPGGSTTPPGGVVSPPSTSGAIGTPLAGSAPGATVLPSTGMAGDLAGYALLGLLLVGLGLVTSRRAARVPC